jgi:hypothetical protein
LHFLFTRLYLCIFLYQKVHLSFFESCRQVRIPQLANQFRSMQNTLPLNLVRLLMNFVAGGGQKWPIASKPSIGLSAAAITFPRVGCKNGFALKTALERRVEHPRGHKHAHRLRASAISRAFKTLVLSNEKTDERRRRSGLIAARPSQR